MTTAIDSSNVDELQQGEVLCFEKHLTHAYNPLTARFERNVEILENMIEIIRMRIQFQAEYAKNFEKIVEKAETIVPQEIADSSLAMGLFFIFFYFCFVFCVFCFCVCFFFFAVNANAKHNF